MDGLSSYELEHICSFLDIEDVMSLKLTNKAINARLSNVNTNLTNVLINYLNSNQLYEFEKFKTHWLYSGEIIRETPNDYFAIATMTKNNDLLKAVYKYFMNHKYCTTTNNKYDWCHNIPMNIFSNIVKSCIYNNWIDGLKTLCDFNISDNAHALNVITELVLRKSSKEFYININKHLLELRKNEKKKNENKCFICIDGCVTTIGYLNILGNPRVANVNSNKIKEIN
jgi:hypothetical protein